MVRGLDIFKEYFEEYSDNYVIIGGTACDIILIVEALNADYVKQFWQFIKNGNYVRKERRENKRKYYRFMNPEIFSNMGRDRLIISHKISGVILS